MLGLILMQSAGPISIELELIGVCGIVSPASSSTAGHELGHVYGAKHNDFQNFGWFSHTVMENGKQSRNGNDPQILEEFKYSDCAKSAIRDSDIFNFW